MTREHDVAIERMAEADTLIFEQNKGRHHRLRPAHPAEASIGLKGRDPVPAGAVVYAVVRQLAPGVRASALLLGPPGADKPDASKAEARAIFASASSPNQLTSH